MRILMLTWEYPPHVVGGLGVHVGALVPALARKGVQVDVLTPRWAGGEPEEQLVDKDLNSLLSSTIYRVTPPVASMGNFYADAQETNRDLEEVGHRLLHDNRYDLIHAHDWLVSFAALSLKRLHKVPLLATIHATERGRGRGNLGSGTSEAINGAEWWLTYEAWRVITASRYMASEVANYFQVPADKVDVVPNGVDTTPFDRLDGTDLAAFRAAWARPEQRIIFSVGRMVQEKGAQLIVEAAPRVLAQFPECKFIIAGTGGMVDYLRKRVQDLGIADRVNVAGLISDTDRNRLLKTANLAVFPSLYEPFGIVALEAMGAKCPVVASSVGGLSEVVQHNKTGITIYPDSVDSLAWGILETLKDPGAATARAARAYDMVKNQYSWDHVAAETMEVYQRIARERAQAQW